MLGERFSGSLTPRLSFLRCLPDAETPIPPPDVESVVASFRLCNQVINLLRQGKIACADTTDIVCVEGNHDATIDIRPFRVMIHRFS